jgi:hypothetical protein
VTLFLYQIKILSSSHKWLAKGNDLDPGLNTGIWRL